MLTIRRLPFPGSARMPFWSWLLLSVLSVILAGGYGSPAVVGASSGHSHALTGLAHLSQKPSRAGSRARLGGTVVIDSVSGSLWSCGFNPFSSATDSLSEGVIYEPLVYINTLTGKETPWLATSYSWSNGNKTLTFTTRHGVHWSDG